LYTDVDDATLREKQTLHGMSREAVAESYSLLSFTLTACLRKTRKAEALWRRISIRRDSEIKSRD